VAPPVTRLRYSSSSSVSLPLTSESALERRSQTARLSWEKFTDSSPASFRQSGDYTSCPLTASTPEPAGGARCVSSARRDLCGARGEILAGLREVTRRSGIARRTIERLMMKRQGEILLSRAGHHRRTQSVERKSLKYKQPMRGATKARCDHPF
jgi:hypothetical protein